MDDKTLVERLELAANDAIHDDAANAIRAAILEMARLDAENFRLAAGSCDVEGGKIGAVEQYLPTFEREIKGKRYVASRWTSKHPRWVALPEKSVSWNPYRCWMSTRKEAITALLRALGE